MNIVNSLSKGWRDVTKGSQKIYYDLAKSPYVTCPRCSANIAIPTEKSGTTTSTTSDVKMPPLDKKESLEDPEPGSQPTQSLRTLCCPSCGMTLNYVPPPTNMPQSETTTAPSSHIVAPRSATMSSSSSSSLSEGITGSKSS